MTAIFAMQAYWLYNQYEYSSTVKAEELKQACTKALEEEKDIRLDKQEDGKDDSSYVRMQIVLKIDQSTKKTKEKDRQVKSTIRYTLPDTKKQLKVRNIDMTEGVELTSRYMASQEKRFDRDIFDSLLYSAEDIKTDSFRFVKTNRCMIKPTFSVSGGLSKTLHVRYSTNPLEMEAVEMTIHVPASHILADEPAACRKHRIARHTGLLHDVSDQDDNDSAPHKRHKARVYEEHDLRDEAAARQDCRRRHGNKNRLNAIFLRAQRASTRQREGDYHQPAGRTAAHSCRQPEQGCRARSAAERSVGRRLLL